MNIPHRLALVIGLLCVASGPTSAFAASRTWSGAGPNNLWSTPQNWVGNIAPVAGDGVSFPNGALQTTNVNDLPAGTLFAAIQFQGTYIVSGNRVLIDNNIRVNGANGAIVLFGCDITTGGNGATVLFVDVGPARFLITTGIISGAQPIQKIDEGTWNIGGAQNNTYTAETRVLAGVIVLDKTDGIVAVPAGLSIGDNLGGSGADIVRLASDRQIVGPVIVRSSGLLDLNGHFDSIGALTMSSRSDHHGNRRTHAGSRRRGLRRRLDHQRSPGARRTAARLPTYSRGAGHACAHDQRSHQRRRRRRRHHQTRLRRPESQRRESVRRIHARGGRIAVGLRSAGARHRGRRRGNGRARWRTGRRTRHDQLRTADHRKEQHHAARAAVPGRRHQGMARPDSHHGLDRRPHARHVQHAPRRHLRHRRILDQRQRRRTQRATNTYLGDTRVQSGTLRINGGEPHSRYHHCPIGRDERAQPEWIQRHHRLAHRRRRRRSYNSATEPSPSRRQPTPKRPTPACSWEPAASCTTGPGNGS